MRSLRAIATAGVVVGILDGLAAVISAGARGITPDRVFQYISSGIFGRSAFDGGMTTVLLGVVLHFVTAFGASAVFVFAARSLPLLNRAPLITGPIYGVIVYFFMSEVVSALSNVSRQPRTLSGTGVGILIHICFVGLPIAIISSRVRAHSRDDID